MTLHEVARVIKEDWKNISPHAKPYIDAMSTLNSIEDNYGLDTGKSVVLYFLCNAGTWRGQVARDTKKHLKTLVKG